MANVYGSRQMTLTTTGTIPFGNFKVKGGIWTGSTSGNVFTLVDESGNTMSFTSYANNYPINIPEMGWLSGPVSITSLPSGTVQLYLATK